MLRYGNPTYRYEPWLLERELEGIRALGVELRCSTAIDGACGVEALLERGFDAVFVACGLGGEVRLIDAPLPGNVLSSASFLEALRTEAKEGMEARVRGSRLAVLGGGSVAIDCAESAVRLGAEEVRIVYRRSWREMPATLEEKISACDGGVDFVLLHQPLGYVANKQGDVCGVRVARTRMGGQDSTGRRVPEVCPESERVLQADLVVEALAQQPRAGSSEWYPRVEVGPEGRIRVQTSTGATTARGIFASGDIVRGRGLVADAVGDGRAGHPGLAGLASARGASARRRGNERHCGGGGTMTTVADVRVEFCGFNLRNPFMLSSPPVSNSAEMIARAFEAGRAGVAYKAVVTDRIPIIHPSPRMHGVAYGSQRLGGLQNVEQTSDRGIGGWQRKATVTLG